MCTILAGSRAGVHLSSNAQQSDTTVGGVRPCRCGIINIGKHDRYLGTVRSASWYICVCLCVFFFFCSLCFISDIFPPVTPPAFLCAGHRVAHQFCGEGAQERRARRGRARAQTGAATVGAATASPVSQVSTAAKNSPCGRWQKRSGWGPKRVNCGSGRISHSLADLACTVGWKLHNVNVIV